MRSILLIIGTCLLCGIEAQLTKCTITCEPDEEFLAAETQEWDDFMNLLVYRTFFEYALPCSQNTSQSVMIDQNDDFLWDLRFKIYSERQDQTKKTLMQCYCEHQQCDDPFKACMKEVRVAMLEELRSYWGSEIGKELSSRRLLC